MELLVRQRLCVKVTIVIKGCCGGDQHKEDTERKGDLEEKQSF